MEARSWYAHWPKGLPMSLEYPRVPVARFLESSAKKYPDKPAIIFQVGDEVTTYAELHEKARRFATALREMGVRKGDRVAVQHINTAHTAMAYFGIMLAGAVYVPCNPLLSFRELLNILNDSGAETFVIFDMFIDKFMPIRHDTPVKRLIVTGIQEFIPPHVPLDVKQYGGRSYSLLQLLNDTPDDAPIVELDPDEDLAHIAYTGGTTGVPKGVATTHQMVVTTCVQQAHWSVGGRVVVNSEGMLEIHGALNTDEPGWEYPCAPGSGKWLVIVPWSHAMGINAYLNIPIYRGDTMIVHPRVDLPTYMADLVRHKVQFCGGAPQLLVAMLNYPGIENLDLSHVRYMGSGAAALPVEVLNGLQRLMPEGMVLEGYGLTEMTLGSTANPGGRSAIRKPGSVGIPFFDCDLKIVDVDDPSVEIGVNELGEVCTRGPQMMRGYWRNPAETAKVIRDGWLLTGDIGYMDEEGYLFLVDRKKDMLIYNGHNVYPRELEELLFTHRGVLNCAVIGKPHSLTGEIPKAFVIRKPGVSITEQELMDFISIRVADYKQVREVEFVEELPISYAGKVLRRELRRMELERIQTGEAKPETEEKLGL
jgi:long-chain acyl-CoA synthetase